jgi:hypothetical protein
MNKIVSDLIPMSTTPEQMRLWTEKALGLVSRHHLAIFWNQGLFSHHSIGPFVLGRRSCFGVRWDGVEGGRRGVAVGVFSAGPPYCFGANSCVRSARLKCFRI